MIRGSEKLVTTQVFHSVEMFDSNMDPAIKRDDISH